MTELNNWKLKYFWQLNSVLMFNWIVWNRTVSLYKNGFGIKQLTKFDLLWNPTNQAAPHELDVIQGQLLSEV